MTYKNFLTIASILAFLFGLGFALMPGQLVSFYGVDLNAAGTLIGQLYGAALLGFGLLNWFARDFGDDGAKQAVLTVNLASDALGFIFALMGQLGGKSRSAKKLRSAKLNLAKARAARHKKVAA